MSDVFTEMSVDAVYGIIECEVWKNDEKENDRIMKKMWMYILLGIVAVSMMACSAEIPDAGDASEAEHAEVQETQDSSEAEETPEAEETETEGQSDTQEEPSEPENAEPVSSYSDAEIFERMDPVMAGFLSWAGLRLEAYDGVQSLDDAMRGEMIAFAHTYSSANIEPWDENMGYAYLAPEQVQEYAVAYFGEEIDTSFLPGADEADENYVVATEDGGLAVSLGDWGVMAPVSFGRVVSNEGDTVVMEYVYELYDFMEERTFNQIGRIEYVLRADQSAPNGFYIDNISVTYDMVYYGDAQLWEGENIVYESPLGYSIETPSALAGRISIVSEGGQDVIISTVCEEENYGGVLCYITANGDSYDVIYPDGMQYDSDSAEKTEEYTVLMKYLPTILSTMSY